MSKHAIILGIGSDIGREIAERLRADNWALSCYRRNEVPHLVKPWDLIVCCYGTLEPIGSFWEVDVTEWMEGLRINALLPLSQVKRLYPSRRSGASVCFFSGAGANGPAPTYSAYCASKIMLVKMVECLDAESEDCKFFILGPGMVKTKIQEQTLCAGTRAANYQRVADFVAANADSGPSHDRIFKFLLACVDAPKAAVGGRNFYVPLDDPGRLGELAGSPDVFKLRRAGDDALRKPI